MFCIKQRVSGVEWDFAEHIHAVSSSQPELLEQMRQLMPAGKKKGIYFFSNPAPSDVKRAFLRIVYRLVRKK